MTTTIRTWLFFALLVFAVSCGKKTDETSDTTPADTVSIASDDFTESNEDLMTVDYKQFYDQLAPKGEWVEVTGKDIGVDMKTTSSNEPKHRTISFAEFFGIKDAYADDIDIGSFFVWKPSAELSAGVTVDDEQPEGYQPYANGEWLNTDAGWYFKAPTPEEEITSHYGRWVNSPSLGYTWMPGRVWSPAWVDWKENETYVAWEPVPPSITIVNNVITPPPVVVENYRVVEKKNFVQPSVYKYMYKENKNKIMIKEWKRIDGVMVKEKTIINKGPDVGVIRTVSGNPCNEVKVVKVNSKDKVKYTSNEISVFSPQFKKVKGKPTKPYSKPNAFAPYDKVKEKHEKKDKEDKGKDSDADKDKGKGNDDKVKGKDKEDKGKDSDADKNKGKGNDDKDKGKDKGKDNDKGKDKGNEKQKVMEKPGKDNSSDKDKGKDKKGK